jgi:PadR family transcriptional regulator, regulatory protein PadR
MAAAGWRVPVYRDLELGAMRTHMLHHGAQAPVYGLWMLEELERRNYDLSHGTFYPALHKIDEERLLCRDAREGR